MPPHKISKSSFLKFEQCPKAFFLYKNMPYLRDKITTDKQLTFKRGHVVGNFARQLIPGGIDVCEGGVDMQTALDLTAALIERKEPVIYEATFMHREVLVMVDILHYENNRYVAYEVKSSLRVSDFFLRDACLQYFVLSNCLTNLWDMFLVTVNADFVKNGKVEAKQFFRKRSVKKLATGNIPYFNYQVEAALTVLEQNKIPNIPVGPQCFRPYQCDFFETCWKEPLSGNSVFHLPHTSKELQFEWHRAGMKLIDQVPDEVLQKSSLVKIKQAFVINAPIYDLDAINTFIRKLNEPVAALDMEIWNPAIPELEGTGPFQQVPFLVGLYSDDGASHFFTSHEQDERENFANALIRLSEPYNTILVYDRNLEISIISKLQAMFPHLSEKLEALKRKTADVADIFLKMHYYDPAFKNSFSLKVVSAVLLGDMKYENIASGLEAMSYYENYRLSKVPEEKETLKNALVKYCVIDSESTFRLLHFLKNLQQQKTPSRS